MEVAYDKQIESLAMDFRNHKSLLLQNPQLLIARSLKRVAPALESSFVQLHGVLTYTEEARFIVAINFMRAIAGQIAAWIFVFPAPKRVCLIALYYLLQPLQSETFQGPLVVSLQCRTILTEKLLHRFGNFSGIFSENNNSEQSASHRLVRFCSRVVLIVIEQSARVKALTIVTKTVVPSRGTHTLSLCEEQDKGTFLISYILNIDDCISQRPQACQQEGWRRLSKRDLLPIRP